MAAAQVTPVSQVTPVKDARPRNELGEAVRFLGVVAVVVAGVAITDALGLGPWPATVLVALVLVVGAQGLGPLAASLAVVLAWCTVTGFAAIGAADLSFDLGDLARLGVLAGAAVVAVTTDRLRARLR